MASLPAACAWASSNSADCRRPRRGTDLRGLTARSSARSSSALAATGSSSPPSRPRSRSTPTPSFIVRAWRALTGEQINAKLNARVDYSHSAVERVVSELQRRIGRPPVNAVLVPSFDRLTVKSGHGGVALAAGLLRREIATALVTPRAPRLLEVPIRHLRPRVTVAVLRRRYPSFITIDRAAFRLRLYSHLRLVRSYPIAVGQVGLQTPAGLYHIQDKVVNPSWQVPFSAWTGSLARRLIPPGPDDPLKARWLGIFNGAGIHGTDETWSIGHAVSHGCVRMTIPDVIDLYDRVSVGTSVYIGD